MDSAAIVICGLAFVAIAMWRLNSIQEDTRILRAELRKGAPLTDAEEEDAAAGRVLQFPVTKA